MSDTSRKILWKSPATAVWYVTEWGFAHLFMTEMVRVDIGGGASKIVKRFRHPTEEERNNV